MSRTRAEVVVSEKDAEGVVSQSLVELRQAVVGELAAGSREELLRHVLLPWIELLRDNVLRELVVGEAVEDPCGKGDEIRPQLGGGGRTLQRTAEPAGNENEMVARLVWLFLLR